MLVMINTDLYFLSKSAYTGWFYVKDNQVVKIGFRNSLEMIVINISEGNSYTFNENINKIWDDIILLKKISKSDLKIFNNEYIKLSSDISNINHLREYIVK
jgi:hypothetical protein